MKRRVIFTIYIDIPEHLLDESGYSRHANVNRHRANRAGETKDKLSVYKNRLMWTQKNYADICDADYKIFINNKQWVDYYLSMKKVHEGLPMYHIVNYYKHHLLYELSKDYDEVFYVDLDIIPVTEENVFEEHDLSYFWAKNNNELAEWGKRFDLSKYDSCDRNPAIKYWNCYALLLQEGFEPENDVINTGTMLGGREVLQEINWPEKFPIMVEKLKKLQDDDETMFPPALHSRFAFDNETMTSYLVKSENFKYASLSDEWLGRLPDNGFDPNHKILHAINKRFEFIWPDVNFEGRKF